MLKDSMRIYALMFGFIIVLFLLFFWYRSSFATDSAVLRLNDVVLTQAVAEVDPVSRFYEGSLLLSPTFETSVWEQIEDRYVDGSVVQFEYKFDSGDSRFDDVPDGDRSPEYIIGETAPSETNMDHLLDRPVTLARVMIRIPSDDLRTWTYTGSITVDAASR